MDKYTHAIPGDGSSHHLNDIMFVMEALATN